MDTQRRIMFVRMICRISLCALGFFTYSYARTSLDSTMVEKDPVFADFCFYKDTSTFIQGDSAFILSYYKMERDLSFSINFISTTSSTSFGISLPNLDMDKIRTNFLQGITGTGPCTTMTSHGEKKHKGTCSGKIEFTPYNLIDFFISTKDSLYIKSLFDTEVLLTWKYILNFGIQKQEIKGENIIYISGLCTDYQQKIIQKRKRGFKL